MKIRWKKCSQDPARVLLDPSVGDGAIIKTDQPTCCFYIITQNKTHKIMCNSEASPKCWIAELQVLQMDDLIGCKCLWRDVSKGKQDAEFWDVLGLGHLFSKGPFYRKDLTHTKVSRKKSWNHGHRMTSPTKSSRNPGFSFMKTSRNPWKIHQKTWIPQWNKKEKEPQLPCQGMNLWPMELAAVDRNEAQTSEHGDLPWFSIV